MNLPEIRGYRIVSSSRNEISIEGGGGRGGISPARIRRAEKNHDYLQFNVSVSRIQRTNGRLDPRVKVNAIIMVRNTRCARTDVTVNVT